MPRHDDVKSRFSQFCEKLLKPRQLWKIIDLCFIYSPSMADNVSDVLEPKNESHYESCAVHPTHTFALNNPAVHTTSLNVWSTLSQKIKYVIWRSPFSGCTLLRWGQHLVPQDGLWRTERGEEDYRTWLAENLWALQEKVYKLNALNNLLTGNCCIKPLSVLKLVLDKKKQTLLCLVSRSAD